MDPVLHVHPTGYYSVCEMPERQEPGEIVCPRCQQPGEVLSPADLKARIAALGYVIHEDGDTFTVSGSPPLPFDRPDASPSLTEALAAAAKTVAKNTVKKVTRRKRASK